jgi:hypothetical protein
MEPRNWFLIQIPIHQDDLQANLHTLSLEWHVQDEHPNTATQK